MPFGMSLARSVLAATVTEGLLYGMYCVLFGITMYLLVVKRRKNKVTIALTAGTVLMFCISTVHLGAMIAYSFTEFLYHDAANKASTILFHPGDSRICTAISLEVANCVIGDAIVIWRVWVLWSHRPKAIVLPGFFWIASIVSGIGCSREFAIAAPGEDALLAQTGILKWGLAYMTSTFLTNFAAVVAIAYRYWTYRREVVSVLGKDFSEGNSVMLLVIESGVLYCLTWALTAIMYLAGNRSVYVLIQALSQFTGIYPTLIVVLVCLKMTQRDRFDKMPSTTLRFNEPNALSCDIRASISIPVQMHSLQRQSGQSRPGDTIAMAADSTSSSLRPCHASSVDLESQTSTK